MPRFVLLHHECPPGYVKPSHWDFMLEADGVLWTWELRELPAVWRVAGGETASRNHDSVIAARLADHRLAYLDYEGPLTQDRGAVMRVDSGEFEIIENVPTRLLVRLAGQPLQEIIELAETNQQDRWQFSVRD